MQIEIPQLRLSWHSGLILPVTNIFHHPMFRDSGRKVQNKIAPLFLLSEGNLKILKQNALLLAHGSPPRTELLIEFILILFEPSIT